MKTAAIVSAACFAAGAVAAPTKRQTTDIDPTVIKFALTLEHLEDKFYRDALQKFSAADFKAAGAPDSFYTNLQYISRDETTHVKQLTDALNAVNIKPVEECTYKFPYTDAKSFLGLSTILEGVGTSAYLGAAPLITNKAYLTAAGSILVSEALHTSLLRSTTGLVPNANPNGTPLGPNPVFTLAAPFIEKCPEGSPALPFKAFPSLTGPAAPVNQGSNIQLATGAEVPQGAFATFVSGLAVKSVALGPKGYEGYSVAVPAEASGQTYVLITKADASGKLADDNVVAGPAIIEVNPAAV